MMLNDGDPVNPDKLQSLPEFDGISLARSPSRRACRPNSFRAALPPYPHGIPRKADEPFCQPPSAVPAGPQPVPLTQRTSESFAPMRPAFVPGENQFRPARESARPAFSPYESDDDLLEPEEFGPIVFRDGVFQIDAGKTSGPPLIDPKLKDLIDSILDPGGKQFA